MKYGFEIAFVLVLAIIFVSETISAKLKGKVPALFLMTVITLIGYWTVIPMDIVEVSGLSAVKNIMMMIILIHMGTLLELEQLKREWKTVVIALAAVVGIAAIFLSIGGMLLGDKLLSLTAIAPLAGGGMAGILTSQALTNGGFTDLAVWPILLITLQGFVGMPIVAFLVRGEMRDLLAKVRRGELKHPKDVQAASDASQKTKLIDKLPALYKTPVFYFLILAILGTLNLTLYVNVTSKIPYVSLMMDKSIMALVIGVVLGNLGLLDKGVMSKTMSSGILDISFYAYIMTFLTGASVATIKAMMLPLVLTFVMATIAIGVFSWIVGRGVGYTGRLAMAVGYNCYLGFPFNYMITKEAARAVAGSPEEEEILFDTLLPTMLIAGFICVTIVSVLMAGVLSAMI